MNQRNLEQRLDNLELLIREIHARVMVGDDAPLKPGDLAIKIAAREWLKGNNAPMRALGGRKMVRG